MIPVATIAKGRQGRGSSRHIDGISSVVFVAETVKQNQKQNVLTLEICGREEIDEACRRKMARGKMVNKVPSEGCPERCSFLHEQRVGDQLPVQVQ